MQETNYGLKVDLPLERVRYELQVIGTPTLESLVREAVQQMVGVVAV